MWTNHRVTPPLRYTFESIVNYWFQTAFADVLAKIAGRDFYTIPSATSRASRATTSFLTSDKLLFYAQNLPTCLTERRWSRVRSSRLTWWASPPLRVVRLDSLKTSSSSVLPLVAPPVSSPLGLRRFFAFARTASQHCHRIQWLHLNEFQLLPRWFSTSFLLDWWNKKHYIWSIYR